MRAAPLPAPLRYPSHASPALADSCSSSFSRAMTRCLTSAGRGLPTSYSCLVSACVTVTLVVICPVRSGCRARRGSYRGEYGAPRQEGAGQLFCHLIARGVNSGRKTTAIHPPPLAGCHLAEDLKSQLAACSAGAAIVLLLLPSSAQCFASQGGVNSGRKTTAIHPPLAGKAPPTTLTG